ncbi:MAG: ABC transporter ATP-binding protein [Patescibacteria group bacterium]
MKNVIEVKNLCKYFSIKQKEFGFLGGIKSLFGPKYKMVEAVNNISFEVREGELLSFIGPNGAGKSTTIKMLTGILFPTGGQIQVLGLDPQKQRQKLAYKIGSVFGQKSQLWYHLPSLDTYNLYAKIYELDQKKYTARLDFLVEQFEIADLLKIPVRKLSLGQRMRCEIAASLLHEPKILFLDEPTIGLDVIAKQKIREVIKFLNEKEKVTIFLTSHDVGDIESLARRTIIVNYGRIVFDDETRRLKERYVTKKIVELIFEQKAKKFEYPAGKVIERKENRVKVEIDLQEKAIDKLLGFAVKNYDIIDMNVYDRPMEEIIADIYRQEDL